jgi:DNA-binding transcriptional regulator GbsR (MarR family)
MQMTPAVEKYVLHWGEMGTRWGTNRTVAQVQALLYLSPKPLRADEIVDLLSVARSNVSIIYWATGVTTSNRCTTSGNCFA